jgi:hypothetical protein
MHNQPNPNQPQGQDPNSSPSQATESDPVETQVQAPSQTPEPSPDHVPGLTEIVEPLTGSSVIIEPAPAPVETAPVAKKPSFFERLKARPKQKHHKAIIFSVIAVLIIIGITVAGLVSRTSHLDYSQSYQLAKDLKKEVQLIRSDTSCTKAIDYVGKSFVSMETYSTYTKDCQTMSDTPEQYINQLAQTEGVRRDQNIKSRYDLFADAYRAAVSGSKTLAVTLDQYLIWHRWVIAIASNASEISWTDSDIESTAKILTESDVPAFVKHGEEWQKYFGEYVVASRDYYTASFSDEHKEDLRNAMTDKKKAYEDWKTKNDPNISELIPLENPDAAYLYAKFEELYDAIRQAYQENYNKEVGGCKEMANQVVCD